MNSVVPPHLRKLFEDAGWSSERSKPLLHENSLDAVYREIGGLRVGKDGPGIQCGVSEVDFETAPIRDPELATWESLLGTSLFRLGSVSGGYASIFISSELKVFGVSEVHDAFYFIGETVPDALDCLFAGRRVRPLFRPDQEFVSLYGDRYHRSHPEAYVYSKESLP